MEIFGLISSAHHEILIHLGMLALYFLTLLLGKVRNAARVHLDCPLDGRFFFEVLSQYAQYLWHRLVVINLLSGVIGVRRCQLQLLVLSRPSSFHLVHFFGHCHHCDLNIAAKRIDLGMTKTRSFFETALRN